MDRPGIPELIALALDQGLLDFAGQRQVTLSLNGAAWAELWGDDATDPVERQSQYLARRWLRRVAGKASFGGQGEALDRDGDGVAEAPRSSESLTDAIAWEVELRLGSRERRTEAEVKERFGSAIATRRTLFEQIWAALSRRHGAAPRVTARQLEELLASPEIEESLNRRATIVKDAPPPAPGEEDRRFVLTLFSAGVRREEVLGPDKLSFGARAGWGWGAFDHTVNASWSRLGGPAALPHPTQIKLGYEITGRFWKRHFEMEKPATWGVFAAWERHRDTPAARHDTIVQVGGRFGFAVAKGVHIPLTVKWANHRDLLAGKGQVVGNVGVSLDFSDLGSRSIHPTSR